MCATVSRDSVQSPTCAPSRAAAYAASQPACPAPITMTSNRHAARLLADQNRSKMCASRSSRRALAGDLLERVRARPADRRARTPPTATPPSASAASRARRSAASRPLDQRDVPDVGDRRPIDAAARRPARASNPLPQRVEPVAGRRRHLDAIRASTTQAPADRLLFATRTISAVDRRATIAGSEPASGPIGPSTHAASRRRRRSACRDRATPSASTRSSVSRRPAVSTSVTRSPSMSTVSVTRSRVVPGTSVTMARAAPTSALNRLDLPTFGAPTIAT